MFQCSNVPMFQYSNAQMLKCSNFLMLKCSNVQMFKFSNDPVFQCSNVQMFKCSNVQMSKLLRELGPLLPLLLLPQPQPQPQPQRRVRFPSVAQQGQPGGLNAGREVPAKAQEGKGATKMLKMAKYKSMNTYGRLRASDTRRQRVVEPLAHSSQSCPLAATTKMLDLDLFVEFELRYFGFRL